MAKRKLIYLDDVVLTFASGAKEYRGSKREAAAISALRVGIVSGHLDMAQSFVHRFGLSRYANRGRRGQMAGFLRLTSTFIRRTRQFDVICRALQDCGLSVDDAAHVAAARIADATLLTFDKQVLHLASQYPILLGRVTRPSRWLRQTHGKEEE